MHVQRTLVIAPLLLVGWGGADFRKQPVSPRSNPGVAILLVDTDHRSGRIDVHVYGQFL